MKFVRSLLTALAVVPSLIGAQAKATTTASVDEEYDRAVKPGWDFLKLVNNKFSSRECLRDRSHLGDDYEVIAQSLAKIYLVRGDLRKDVRELFMRLATFQTLPEDVRHLAIPLPFPPQTDDDKRLNQIVLDARTAFWVSLDRLDAKYPLSDGEKAAKQGLLINVEDRGWRPESPLDVLHENDNCQGGSDA